MVFFVIMATDIGAYFFGKKFGKKQLSPEVSPKKTVVGAVAGSVCAILTSLVLGFFFKLSFSQAFWAGAIITFFAQVGDLSESLLKRDAGVKDSGNSLPGHGGFLDRADSYLLAAPVSYFFFKYVVLTDLSLAQFITLAEKVLSNAGIM